MFALKSDAPIREYPPYPEEIVDAFIRGNVLFPQMVGAQAVGIGNLVLGHNADTRSGWQAYEGARPSTKQCIHLGDVMMRAHRAAGVRVWLGSQMQKYLTHAVVPYWRVGMLMEGTKDVVALTMARYAHTLPGYQPPEKVLSGRKRLSTAEQRQQTLLETNAFMEQFTVDGQPKPELRALAMLFSVANDALQPGNPKAREVRDVLRRDLHTMTQYSFLFGSLARLFVRKRRSQAVERLKTIPAQMQDVISEAIDESLPDIEATLGYPLSKEMRQAFLGVVGPISVAGA